MTGRGIGGWLWEAMAHLDELLDADGQDSGVVDLLELEAEVGALDELLQQTQSFARR